MSIDRGMDQEVMVHIYNEILFSHKSERIWVHSSEVDEPRACYTECSQKNKYHILMQYMESRIIELLNLFAGQQ